MLGLDDHADAARLEDLVDRGRDLRVHVLLGLPCAAALIAFAPFICTAGELQRHSNAIMDFELIDNTGESAKDAEQKRRLAMISQQLREAIAENQLYTVVDNAPAAPLIA